MRPYVVSLSCLLALPALSVAVIRDGRLFESFNYGFQGPTPEGTGAIPMGFTRYLRPGPIQLRLLVEDVFDQQYAQIVRDLDR